MLKETDNLLKNIYTCSYLDNMVWGVWALLILEPAEITKEGIFNFDYAETRVKMSQKSGFSPEMRVPPLGNQR